MRRLSLLAVFFAACGHAPPPAAPPPPAPTLADEVDAICACKTPACVEQTHKTFAGAESNTDPTPHVQALRDKIASCETIVRDGDELGNMRAMETAMCACKDAACVDHVQKDYAAFMKSMEEKYKGDRRPDEALMQSGEHLASCMTDAMGGSADADDVGGATPDVAAPPTGVAACDEYLHQFDLYMSCDKIPKQAVDASRKGIAQMKRGWAMLKDPKVPPEALKAAANACAQATQALRESAKAMGCPL